LTEKKGRLIVFEGIDGSGISTQTARLQSYLETAYQVKAILAKEPSEGPVGALIRQVLTKRLQGVDDRTLALLFAADRIDHNRSKILPALNQGDYVICDRYLWSSYAYQGREIDSGWIKEINRYATKPDLTVFIHVRPETAIQRITKSRFQTELFEKTEILKQVLNNYRTLYHEWKNAGENVIEINGEQEAAKVEMEIRSLADRFIAGNEKKPTL
jgi:dTMP kinase